MYRYNRSSPFERTPEKRVSRQESQRKSIELPKLPPLNTRNSFLDDSDNGTDNISIGWTPISDTQQFQSPVPQAFTFTSKHSARGNGTSSSESTPKSTKYVKERRPPPPPPLLYSTESIRIDSPMVSPSSQSRERSPNKLSFIGNSEERHHMEYISNHSRILKSPFANGFSPNSPKSPRDSSKQQAHFSDESDLRCHEREKALPPIPFTTTLLLSPFDDEDSEFFTKPPPPLSTSRNVSGNSRVSEALESVYSDSDYTFNNSNARQSSFNSLLGAKPLELAPSITAPTQPFSIQSIDEHKLYQCDNVYKLSAIYEWILKVYFEWFNECVFTKIDLFQIVQLLLEFQMPTNFDQDTIDSNVDNIMASFISQKAVRFDIINDEEVAVVVGGLDITGVFTELLPCYSFIDNTYGSTNSLICYSNVCTHGQSSGFRKEIKLSEIINKSVGLWTEYWHLTPDDLAEINPREVQRQSFIFDLIILEERSLNMATAAVEIYGKRFDKSLLPDEPEFKALAFDIFEPLIQLHTEFLLTPIFWKLKTRGKFIDGVGKIYSKWCGEAKNIYLNYAKAMATVHEIIMWEKKNKTKFVTWLKEIDNSVEITRSKMYHDVIFFGGFFKSLQNMPVTLRSILKNTDPSMEDYEYLKIVIKEVEKLNFEVNQVHGLAIDHRKLVRFSKQLVLSTNSSNATSYVNVGGSTNANDDDAIQDKLALGLTYPERKLVLSGTVYKKRDLWLDPTPVYIALLDNCLLITEEISKGETQKYKLIERPIPIDYLSLEKRKIPGTSKQPLRNYSQKEHKSPMHNFSTPISSMRPLLKSSGNHMSTAYGDRKTSNTEISNANPNTDEFSFKIRNTATGESFKFFTESAEVLNQWIDAIMESFKRNAENHDLNAFEFTVLSSEFAYFDKDAPVNLPVAPEGSEIDIALKAYAQKANKDSCSWSKTTRILCCEDVKFEGRIYLFVATTDGIYVKYRDDYGSGFVKILELNDVKRMEANVKLGLLFVLDNRKLCYFNISTVVSRYLAQGNTLDENCIVGTVIRDKVRFFKIADDFGNSKHLFFERKGKIVILTPEFDQLTNQVKYFKFYKEYKLPSSSNNILNNEIEDIAIFRKSFAVCTKKTVILYQDSFEDNGIVLPSFLNDKDMMAHLRHPHLNSLPFKSATDSKKRPSIESLTEEAKKDIATCKAIPVNFFQISQSRFFALVYDEAVVKINCYGEMSDWRKDILLLDFCCTGASFHGNHLILVGDNLIQIYDLKNVEQNLGELVPVQIIKGKKIKLASSERREKTILVLSHPNILNRQLLVACNPVAMADHQ
ncbi:Tus1p [Saccharomyces cerevisiae YJM689]|nr:Tus1p [Saccharomyces cerevisiae YJM689]